MGLKGFKRKYKPLELLSEEEVYSIHSATINILKETGVKFESKWAIDFLEKNDCLVDKESKMVRFPEGLVEESIRKAPSTFRAKARESKYDLVYNRDTVYFTDAPAMQTLDLNTMMPRTPSKAEFIEYIKVLDALPTIHYISDYPYFGFEGIPEVMIMPELMANKFIYTSKIHGCPYSNDCEIFNFKMAKVADTDIMPFVAVGSPLTWYDNAVTLARRAIEADFPISYCSGSFYGATAPATIGGGVAKTNAELISILVMIQLIKPGHRSLMWYIDAPQNMITGAPAFGQIGISIGSAIFNQIWRHYEVPTANAFPGFTSAKIPDFQCAYERSMAALISALSGCSMDQLHGCILGELTSSPIQAILDDDIAGMIGRFIEGEPINEETLATDLIREVGPIPGHYLSRPHTRKWWQKEQFIPKSADRTSNYKDWTSANKKTALDFAKERNNKILEEHKPSILEDDKIEEIEKILEEARQYYKKKDML